MITLRKLLLRVSKHTGVSVAKMKGKRRKQKIVDARHLYAYAARRFNIIIEDKCSLENIGKEINRDHTTVINSVKRYTGLIEFSTPILEDFERFRESIKDLCPISEITQEQADSIIKSLIGEYKITDS